MASITITNLRNGLNETRIRVGNGAREFGMWMNSAFTQFTALISPVTGTSDSALAYVFIDDVKRATAILTLRRSKIFAIRTS